MSQQTIAGAVRKQIEGEAALEAAAREHRMMTGSHGNEDSDGTAKVLQRAHPLLRGLLVTAAGFSTGLDQSAKGVTSAEAAFIYCVNGRGWWKSHGRLSLIRKGDLLVVPPGSTHFYGSQPSKPWTTHWARATGENLALYLRELALGPQNPVLHVGNSPQLIRLFAEVKAALHQGAAYCNALQASAALAYLLSCLIRSRQNTAPEGCDTSQSVAQTIIYMSEHIREPLRISTLARIAGLSAAHFCELFKCHTGCSPREYLHLLRIHHACRFLKDSTLSIKEVAGEVGYSDALHFSRRFKAFEGIAPSEYRAKS